jgi:hypothetical protein
MDISLYDKIKFTYTLLKSYSILNNSKLVFVHNPRVGGTFISNYLYGNNVGHTPHVMLKKFIKNKQFFSFCRDPIERFISACNYLYTNGTLNIPANKNGYKYLNKISPNELADNIENFYINDYVLYPQSFFLMPINNIHIYRFEELKKINININLNPSFKFYTSQDLNDESIEKLLKFYSFDSQLYKESKLLDITTLNTFKTMNQIHNKII